MLFSTQSSLRGRIWKLPNGYWRGCNEDGTQCTFRFHNEAQRFAQKTLLKSRPKVVKKQLSEAATPAERSKMKSFLNRAMKLEDELYKLEMDLDDFDHEDESQLNAAQNRWLTALAIAVEDARAALLKTNAKGPFPEK